MSPGIESVSTGSSRFRVSAVQLGWVFFGVALAIYFPALGGGILWDDPAHITAPALQSWSGLGRIWFKLGATQQYYPILETAFWIEHRLWGDHVLGYHLVNVCFHTLSAVLFACVIRRIKGQARGFSLGEIFAAAVFLVHPVCVETVAWISEQKNTLSTVFYLLSALSFLRFDRMREDNVANSQDESSRTVRWYVLALVFFVLALTSKSVTATLPAALLVVQWYRYGKVRWRQDVLPLSVWFVIGASGGLFTAWVEKHYIGAEGTAYALSLSDRAFLAGRVIWFYFGKLVWPAKLIFIYPHWEVRTSLAWSTGLIAALGMTIALWSMRARRRGPLAVWLLFVGTLFPALGFVNVYPFVFSYVADHWQYLACLAPLALFGEFLGELGSSALGTSDRRRWALRAAVGAPILLLLAAKTMYQATNYTDAERLYRVTIAQNPQCWMAYNNLGLALLDRGDITHAETCFRVAISLRPEYSDAHNNLGNALVREPGKLAEAAAEYATAAAIEPRDGELHFNLGNALAGLDRLPEALRELSWAAAILPQRADMHAGLGLALVQAGQLADAESELRLALKLNPNLSVAHYNLARLLHDPSQREEAFAHYRAALKLTPKLAPLWNSYGGALLREGQVEEAVKAYREAVQLEPKNARFHNNFAIALRERGELDEAERESRASLTLDPSFSDAHYNLGIVLEKTNRIQEAETEFQRSGRN
ncbi:MAG TPA: tetratricopeptide repeat protein [Opitutaceae bacterium]